MLLNVDCNGSPKGKIKNEVDSLLLFATASPCSSSSSLDLPRDKLTLEEVPNTERLKAGFFRLDWEGWGPLWVLSVSGDQSCGREAVLEVGTSGGEKRQAWVIISKLG